MVFPVAGGIFLSGLTSLSSHIKALPAFNRGYDNHFMVLFPSYPDDRLGNGGVRISEDSLYCSNGYILLSHTILIAVVNNLTPNYSPAGVGEYI